MVKHLGIVAEIVPKDGVQMIPQIEALGIFGPTLGIVT